MSDAIIALLTSAAAGLVMGLVAGGVRRAFR